MKFIVHSSGSPSPATGRVIEVDGEDPTVAEILLQAKTLLPRFLKYDRTHIFLALPKGPVRLHDDKFASDYELTDGEDLLLMSSWILPD